MKDAIRLNVYVSIKDGRLEDFKGIAKDWSANNHKERPDILSYEWFFMDPGQTKALVMEVYESSEAMLTTLGKVADTEEVEQPDYPYEMIKLEVAGNISDALRKRLDAGPSDVVYYHRFDGFTR